MNNQSKLKLDAGSPRMLAIIFVSILAVGFLFVIGKGLLDVATGSSHPAFGIFLLGFGWLAYQNFFAIYWTLTGSEEIEFTVTDLKYTQIVFGLKRTKTFKIPSIKHAEIRDSSTSIVSLAYSIYGINPYSIRFKYNGRQKIIGAKANMKQAQYIIERLKN